jgi:citrate (Re)-synthase
MSSVKQPDYLHGLQDVSEPNLYKDIFPYSDIPKVTFDNVQLPMDMPEEIWVTDTTFRDGQQSMPPYSAEQIIKLYDYLHKLDNNSGIIRQTEFFLYSEKDRHAAQVCMERGYKFPEVTSWIRANRDDFKLVKQMGIHETGMLMSCSDYHIFKKLKKSRKEALDMYLGLIEDAIEAGIKPRVHLEDITRADFYGFVVPFVAKLMEISRDANVPIKIRACDTLGLAVPYSGASLPRSVQGIMHGLRKVCGVAPENIEWHGHNDFNAVVTNSTTAWMYGCSSVNSSLLGIGERTGNCPLESMLIEYAQFKGTTKNMKLEVITEIAEYFKREMKYDIPPRTPFVGSQFNVTRAGIHADGLLKDEEIYNIFDTDKLLHRPVVVAVNEYSGLAGIAVWINTYYRLKGEDKVEKHAAGIIKIKEWVDAQYAKGRTTIINSDELEGLVEQHMPEILEQKEKVQVS